MQFALPFSKLQLKSLSLCIFADGDGDDVMTFRLRHLQKARPLLRRSVAGLSYQRLWCDPGPVHVGFVVDTVALGYFSPNPSAPPPRSILPVKGKGKGLPRTGYDGPEWE